MTLMKIFTAPDSILTKKAAEVEVVDKSIQKLMNDMLETMYHDEGIGLAANQVGVLKKVIVLDLQDEDPESKKLYPLFMANPEILELSDELVEAEEGCLSLPEQRITLARPEKIKVQYIDYYNKKQELKTGGWLARAIQHEMDHLDGKLLIDHVSKLKKDVYLRKLKRLKKQNS